MERGIELGADHTWISVLWRWGFVIVWYWAGSNPYTDKVMEEQDILSTTEVGKYNYP